MDVENSDLRLGKSLDSVASAISELAEAAPAEQPRLTHRTFLFRDQPPMMQRVNVVLDEALADELAHSGDPALAPDAGVLCGRTLERVNLEDQLTGWVRLIGADHHGQTLNMMVPFDQIAAIYLVTKPG